MTRAIVLASFAMCALGCATIPETAGGNDALPNAAAGPFRPIVTDELGNFRGAPNALEEDGPAVRDGSVVDLDGDPSTLEVFGYFEAGVAPADPAAAPTLILRYGALDGRSFDKAAEVVLEADAPWEGGTIGAPAAVRVGEGIWIYYAAKGGVGLAKSAEGKRFTRSGDGPVLTGARSPGVVRLADGSFRMFFEVDTAAGPAIDEATSTDGERWTRLAGHALEPEAGGSDAKGAGSPAPILAKSDAGRGITRVYYTATNASGAVTIAMAARFGDDGPLERAVSPVYGTANALAPHHPSLVAFDDFTLLFTTENAGNTMTKPAIACGVAPGGVTLPAPNPQ